jgi:hypothetical protein
MKAQGLQMIAALKAELAATQGRLQAMGADKGLDARKLEIEAFKAQTDRMEAEARAGARMVEAV